MGQPASATRSCGNCLLRIVEYENVITNNMVETTCFGKYARAVFYMKTIVEDDSACIHAALWNKPLRMMQPEANPPSDVTMASRRRDMPPTAGMPSLLKKLEETSIILSFEGKLQAYGHQFVACVA